MCWSPCSIVLQQSGRPPNSIALFEVSVEPTAWEPERRDLHDVPVSSVLTCRRKIACFHAGRLSGLFSFVFKKENRTPTVNRASTLADLVLFQDLLCSKRIFNATNKSWRALLTSEIGSTTRISA